MSDLCPIAVAQDATDDEYQPDTASESYLLLFKQKKYCDVTFTFPNLPDRIQAHEFCLKARSPEFAKLFRMRKSGNVPGNEIKISESTPQRFRQFLEFIYADELEVDISGALDLLQLSLKYKVHPLTKRCEQLLRTDIPLLDSVKVFESARRYGRRDLMDRAGQIMVKSFLKLKGAGALDNAEEDTLIYLLECDDLVAEEVVLFRLVLDWGENQVGTSTEAGRLRNKLKNLILKIRYTNMAPAEFATVVLPTRLLSDAETISVYSYFCGDEVTRRDLKMKFKTGRRQVGNLEKDPTKTFSGTVSPYIKFPPTNAARSFQTTSSPRAPTEVKPSPINMHPRFATNSNAQSFSSRQQGAKKPSAPVASSRYQKSDSIEGNADINRGSRFKCTKGFAPAPAASNVRTLRPFKNYTLRSGEIVGPSDWKRPDLDRNAEEEKKDDRNADLYMSDSSSDREPHNHFDDFQLVEGIDFNSDCYDPVSDRDCRDDSD